MSGGTKRKRNDNHPLSETPKRGIARRVLLTPRSRQPQPEQPPPAPTKFVTPRGLPGWEQSHASSSAPYRKADLVVFATPYVRFNSQSQSPSTPTFRSERRNSQISLDSPTLSTTRRGDRVSDLGGRNGFSISPQSPLFARPSSSQTELSNPAQIDDDIMIFGNDEYPTDSTGFSWQTPQQGNGLVSTNRLLSQPSTQGSLSSIQSTPRRPSWLSTNRSAWNQQTRSSGQAGSRSPISPSPHPRVQTLRETRAETEGSFTLPPPTPISQTLLPQTPPDSQNLLVATGDTLTIRAKLDELSDSMQKFPRVMHEAYMRSFTKLYEDLQQTKADVQEIQRRLGTGEPPVVRKDEG